MRRAGNLLKDKGYDVQVLNNLGVNGLRTDALLEKLDEQGVRYVLQQSNFILLSIGANDLFQGGQVLQGKIRQQQSSWQRLCRKRRSAFKRY